MGQSAASRFARALALVAAVGCSSAPAQTETHNADDAELIRSGSTLTVPEGSPLRRRLHIEAIQPEPLRRALSVPGRVEADPARMAHVTAPLPGRIVRLFVRLGASVHAGDPLLEIDSPDLIAAQTDWLNARASLAQTERTLTRQRDLEGHGIASHAELEQAQTANAVAEAELERTRTRLHLLGMTPGSVGHPLTVRAPIDGRVVDFQVAMGEFHSDLASDLMTIADLSTVWIKGAVQERD